MRSGDLIILNSSHGVLVGMVIKRSGPVVHTNHVCGPELLFLDRNYQSLKGAVDVSHCQNEAEVKESDRENL